MAAIELYSTPLISDANLVSYFRWQGNSNDYKGNHNGTPTSALYNDSYGKFGNGVWLQEAGKVQVTPIISTGSDFTIMSWIMLKSTAHTNSAIYDQRTNADGYSTLAFAINKPSNWNLLLQVRNADLSNYADYQDNTTLSYDTWFHVAATKVGTAFKVYVNGAYKGGFTSSATFNAADIACIGSYYDYSTTYGFPGYMDDTAFFSRGLSATELSDYYNGNYAITYNQSLLTTATAVLAFLKVKTAVKSFVLTATSVLSFLKIATHYKTFSLTATSVLALSKIKTCLKVLTTTATSAASFIKQVSKTLALSATAVVEVFSGMLYVKSLTAIASAITSIEDIYIYGRNLVVTATANISLSKALSLFKTFTVTATSVLSITLIKTFLKTLTVTAVSVLSVLKTLASRLGITVGIRSSVALKNGTRSSSTVKSGTRVVKNG